MCMTLNYKEQSKKVEVGGIYYWGQLSENEEITEDGTIAVYDFENQEDSIIEFEVIEIREKKFDSLVKVTDIY